MDTFIKYHEATYSWFYDLIWGYGLLHKPGITFNFNEKTIYWQKVSTPTKQPNCTSKEFFIKEIPYVNKRNKKIFDAWYKQMDWNIENENRKISWR